MKFCMMIKQRSRTKFFSTSTVHFPAEEQECFVSCLWCFFYMQFYRTWKTGMCCTKNYQLLFMFFFGIKFQLAPRQHVRWDSTVGIATCHGLDSPRIESWGGGGQEFLHPSKQAYPASYTTDTGLSWGVKWMGVALTTHPHLVPMFNKSRAIHLLPLRAFMPCSRVNLTFTFTTTAPILPLWTPALLLKQEVQSSRYN
jgi:hypothetical protein